MRSLPSAARKRARNRARTHMLYARPVLPMSLLQSGNLSYYEQHMGFYQGDDVTTLCTASNALLLQAGLKRPLHDLGSIVPLQRPTDCRMALLKKSFRRTRLILAAHLGGCNQDSAVSRGACPQQTVMDSALWINHPVLCLVIHNLVNTYPHCTAIQSLAPLDMLTAKARRTLVGKAPISRL